MTHAVPLYLQFPPVLRYHYNTLLSKDSIGSISCINVYIRYHAPPISSITPLVLDVTNHLLTIVGMTMNRWLSALIEKVPFG